MKCLVIQPAAWVPYEPCYATGISKIPDSKLGQDHRTGRNARDNEIYDFMAIGCK